MQVSMMSSQFFELLGELANSSQLGCIFTHALHNFPFILAVACLCCKTLRIHKAHTYIRKLTTYNNGKTCCDFNNYVDNQK